MRARTMDTETCENLGVRAHQLVSQHNKHFMTTYKRRELPASKGVGNELAYKDVH
jgi:hypothetical protein